MIVFKDLAIVEHEPNGIVSIEASAGTGKTFTIVLLFFKALVRLWRENSGLGIKHILVVTFTEAATKELRSRIRETLVKAQTFYAKETDPLDKTIQSVFESYNFSAFECSKLADYLLVQLNSMDDASILTIHGFCSKIITEFPFECGIPGEFELSPNLSDELEEFVKSEWRSLICSDNESDSVCEDFFKTPQDFIKKFRNQLNSSIVLKHDEDSAIIFDELIKSFYKERKNFIRNFSFEDFENILKKLFDEANLNGKSYSNSAKIKVKNLIRAFYSSNIKQFIHFSDADYEKLNLLHESKIQSSFSRKTIQAIVDELSGFVSDFGQILSILDKIQVQKKEVLATFIATLQIKFQQKKKEEAWFGFDDLLQIVDVALQQNQTLVDKVREAYPIGFIDEFQDTDPVQFSLFKQIYIDAKMLGLSPTFYMIGDPKQSIYGFRNADLKTYIYARSLAEQHFSLNVNYRSTHSVIDSLNTFYSQAEHPFINPKIEYKPVKSVKDGDIKIQQAEFNVPFLVLLVDGNKDVNKDQAVLNAINQTVKLIGNYVTNENYIAEKRIEPGDIGILVKTNRLASQMYQRLRMEGIPAVIQSKQSVFETKDATNLLVLMQAIVQAQSNPKLKLALLSPFFTVKWQDFDKWEKQNEEEKELEYQEAFLEANRRWYKFGFSAAFSFLNNEFLCISNLMQFADGERSVANVMHLIDLISAIERKSKHNPNKTLKEIEIKIIEAAEDEYSTVADEEVLRLESDEKKVKIITIHGSKGLEYPIVIQPFSWHDKVTYYTKKSYIHSLSVPQESTSPKLYKLFVENEYSKKLLEDKSIEQAQIDEIEEEEARHFYVALTRAKYQNVLILPNSTVFDGPKPPFGMLQKWVQLSFPNSTTDLDEKNKFSITKLAFETLKSKQSDLINITDLIPEFDKQILKQELLNKTIFEPSLRTYIDIKPSWVQSSYSSLTAQAESHYDGREKEPILGNLDEFNVPNLPSKFSTELATIPAGADIGNVIHDTLEALDGQELESILAQMELIMNRYGTKAQFEAQEELIAKWIQKIYTTKFVLEKNKLISMATIPKENQKREMEFYLSSKEFDYQALMSVIRSQSDSVNPIQAGFIKGFIDLIFIHEGKFYMLDYKSNKLPNYDDSALQDAMIHHNYDVQMAVYTVALHAFLSATIQNYDYETHFGGMFYWFVRGIDYANQGLLKMKLSKEKVEQLCELMKGELV